MTTFQITIEVEDPQERRFEEPEVPAGIHVGDILRTGTRL